MSSGVSTVARPQPMAAAAPPRALRQPLTTESDGFRLRPDEVTGYVMSFVLHIAAMLSLTITYVVSVQPGSPVPVTVTTELESDAAVNYEPVDVTIESLASDGLSVVSMSPVADVALSENLVLSSANAALSPQGLAPGTGDPHGPSRPSGSFAELPKNAVLAGSFAAWWIPKAERYGEVVEPGHPPRPDQDYRIYVQVLVPKERKSYRVDDLTGEIVGTDGYRQVIPDRAWMTDDRGSLVPAVGARRSLPIVNGVAEIVFKVDAAGNAGVRDTIRIRSRLLDEEQVLTLEFQAAVTVAE